MAVEVRAWADRFRSVGITNVVVTEPQFLLVTAEWVKECVLGGKPRHDEAGKVSGECGSTPLRPLGKPRLTQSKLQTVHHSLKETV